MVSEPSADVGDSEPASTKRAAQEVVISGDLALAAYLFPDFLEGGYRRLVHRLCSNSFGSGYPWTPQVVDDLYIEEILSYLELQDEAREAEASATSASKSVGFRDEAVG